MSQNKHPGGPAPVPPGNRPHTGPAGQQPLDDSADATDPTDGRSFSEQDPQRRLGDYGGAGEHPIQQPGGKSQGK